MRVTITLDQEGHNSGPTETAFLHSDNADLGLDPLHVCLVCKYAPHVQVAS